MPALAELETAWPATHRDPSYAEELAVLSRDFCGRPTPPTSPSAWPSRAGHEIWLKPEDLMHTGAHKINNNCVGQVLLARRIGKRRIIAETGAGQHGVATATICAYFSACPAVVYMGAEDIARQQPQRVFACGFSGPRFGPVDRWSRGRSRMRINEALRDWVANVADTHYVIGSVMGS